MDKNKKIMIFTVVNIIMFIILYNIPIEMANNLCMFKLVLHKECWNCGMTRAFLSLLHFNFKEAINYNKNVIIIFPFTICCYMSSWINYIRRDKENE